MHGIQARNRTYELRAFASFGHCRRLGALHGSHSEDPDQPQGGRILDLCNNSICTFLSLASPTGGVGGVAKLKTLKSKGNSPVQSRQTLKGRQPQVAAARFSPLLQISNVLGLDDVPYCSGPKLMPRAGVMAYLQRQAEHEKQQ